MMILSAAANVAAATGVFVAARQLNLTKKQSQTQFEDGLVQEYRETMHQLPIAMLLGEKVPARTVEENLKAIYRYVDLTNTQLFLRQQRRISDATWGLWRDGIRDVMHLDGIAQAWAFIKSSPAARFGELKRFEKEGFSTDPAAWTTTQPGLSPATGFRAWVRQALRTATLRPEAPTTQVRAPASVASDSEAAAIPAAVATSGAAEPADP
jgi:hypothetical protein